MCVPGRASSRGLVLVAGLMEKVVFGVSFGYLVITHIYRQVYDYGGYTLDITVSVNSIIAQRHVRSVFAQ